MDMRTPRAWTISLIVGLMGLTGCLVAVAMASGARASDSEAKVIEVRISALTKVVGGLATKVDKMDDKLDRLCVAVARLEPGPSKTKEKDK